MITACDLDLHYKISSRAPGRDALSDGLTFPQFAQA